MTFISSSPDRNVVSPGPAKRLGGLKAAVLVDEAITLNQLVNGSYTVAGNTANTGNNTHTGTETFSNAAGVTTNIITERTAGAGTGIKTPVVLVSAATLAPAAIASGTTYSLAKSDGQTITLPAASAANIGVKYKFVITVTCTSVGYVINTTGTDVFIGAHFSTIAAGTNAGLFASTANKTITMGATTTCGLIGGWLEITCVSATQWSVNGVLLGTGTVVTSFSN